MKKQILTTVTLIAGFMSVFFAVQTAITAYKEMKMLEIKQQAATECSKATTATWKDENGAVIVEPYRSAFEQCLKDAGVK